MPFFQVLFLWNFSRLWNHIMRNSHYSVRLFVTPCTAAHQTSDQKLDNRFSSVQSLSPVWIFAILWTTARQASLSINQLPEFTQTHVHWVHNAIQPSHPLSSPSLPTFNLSQHQGLFQWVTSSHQVAKVLEFQLQHQSCQWIFRTDFL